MKQRQLLKVSQLFLYTLFMNLYAGNGFKYAVLYKLRVIRFAKKICCECTDV